MNRRPTTAPPEPRRSPSRDPGPRSVTITVPLMAVAVVSLIAAGCGHDGHQSVTASAPASERASTLPGGTTTGREAPAREQMSPEAVLTPVTQSVLSAPRWYPGTDGRVHLQYELMLTNTVPLPV